MQTECTIRVTLGPPSGSCIVFSHSHCVLEKGVIVREKTG